MARDRSTGMQDRSAWARVAEGPKYLRGRDYSHLIEFRRPCSTCGEPFSIYVTRRIADGEADTNSFGLVNCEAHRYARMARRYAEPPQTMAELREENHQLRAIVDAQARKMPWEV
jgi:hypothetical protein